MNERLRMALLSGGISFEREISLKTGQMVAENLDVEKYAVTLIVVNEDGKWREILSEGNFDFVFIALHGLGGEDGTNQGFLETIGLPYSGSGVLASALGMDKLSSRAIFAQAGLDVPNFFSFISFEYRRDLDKVYQRVISEIGYPCVVKPNNQGSSYGVTIVPCESNLEEALEEAFSCGEVLLVEEYIQGREITAGVLGNSGDPDSLEALPLVEIRPRREFGFFSYEAKYKRGASEEIVPAPLDEDITVEIQEKALRGYQAVGCRGFGRLDFILRDRVPYLLEVNTIPGMTKNSLFPKAARAYGLSFSQLLDRIVELSRHDSD